MCYQLCIYIYSWFWILRTYANMHIFMCIVAYLFSGNINVSTIAESNPAEQKRGQFLGSTLKSTGSTFLVCICSYMYILLNV